MSSPPKRNNSQLIAYVHNVSPVKRNRRNTVDYSTLSLQTADSQVLEEAMCYSTAKRLILMDKEKSRTPVKFSRYTRTSDKKLVINDVTNLSTPDEQEYNFQYDDEAQYHNAVSMESLLADRHTEEKAIICAKIVKIFPTQTVGKANLKLEKAIVVDKTGKIELDLWEEHIEQVKEGASLLKIRNWNGQKKLSTTHGTLFSPSNDETLQDLNPECKDELELESDKTQKINVSSFLSVEIERYKSCINSNCLRRIMQVVGAVVKCDRCGHSMRLSNCQTHTTYAKVTVADSENKQRHLTLFEDCLVSAIGPIDDKTEHVIIEELLFLENFHITYSKNNVFSSMSLNG